MIVSKDLYDIASGEAEYGTSCEDANNTVNTRIVPDPYASEKTLIATGHIAEVIVKAMANIKNKY